MLAPATPRRAPISGRRLLVGCVAIVLIALGILLATFATRPPDPKLTDYGVVGSFSLVDERGQVFGDAAMRGHVSIVGFLFTRCDTICPQTSARMYDLQEKTFDVGDKVKLVAFSVDPAYDTPAVLTAYARRFHADDSRWRFVTGPADRVRAFIEGPLMSGATLDGGTQANGAPSIAHAGYFLLVDPALHIRGKYEMRDIHQLDDMQRAARFLARTML